MDPVSEPSFRLSRGRDEQAAEVRRLADLVKPGECITFPGGITIDKRIPLGGTPPWVPQVPPIPAPAKQWQCSGCGLTAPVGGSFGYVCSKVDCPSGLGGVRC